MNVEIALHELGHGIAIRAFGMAPVRFVIHPFLPSATMWAAPTSGSSPTSRQLGTWL